MTGKFLKRKAKKLLTPYVDRIKIFFYNVRRIFVKHSIKNKDFSIISNNCWAGKVYQYLDMPYLSPTAGLYFFAPDYIKFVSDLHHYLDAPLRFINPQESKYYAEIKRRNQLDKPIGIIDDVEIVFLHYKTREEAAEKWNRRKARVNYDNIILKFSRMDLCTEKEIATFDAIEFKNKFVLNNRLPLKYTCEIYWNEPYKPDGIRRDTEPFPGNIKLRNILNVTSEKYPLNTFSLKEE